MLKPPVSSLSLVELSTVVSRKDTAVNYAQAQISSASNTREQQTNIHNMYMQAFIHVHTHIPIRTHRQTDHTEPMMSILTPTHAQKQCSKKRTKCTQKHKNKKRVRTSSNPCSLYKGQDQGNYIITTNKGMTSCGKKRGCGCISSQPWISSCMQKKKMEANTKKKEDVTHRNQGQKQVPGSFSMNETLHHYSQHKHGHLGKE